VKKEIKRCSKPQLHNFPNADNDSKCKWCGITVRELCKKELEDIDREYRIYRYSYKTMLISCLFILVISIATYFKRMDLWEWLYLSLVLSGIIVFSGLTFLKYYDRIHENPVSR